MDIWERVDFVNELCKIVNDMESVKSVDFKGNNYNGSILITLCLWKATNLSNVEFRDPELDKSHSVHPSTTDPKELVRIVLGYLSMDFESIGVSEQISAYKALKKLEELVFNTKRQK